MLVLHFIEHLILYFLLCFTCLNLNVYSPDDALEGETDLMQILSRIIAYFVMYD